MCGARNTAEKTAAIGENSREKSVLGKKQIFSQRKKLKKLFRKEFENIGKFAASDP